MCININYYETIFHNDCPSWTNKVFELNSNERFAVLRSTFDR